MHVCKINIGSLQVSTVRPGMAVSVVLPEGKALLYGTLQDNLLVCWVISTGRKIQYDTGTRLRDGSKWSKLLQANVSALSTVFILIH